MEPIGRQVARLREQSGLTQQQLGERTRYSRETIAAVECGRLRPSLRFLHEVEAALALPRGQLVKPMLVVRFQEFCARHHLEPREMLGYLREAFGDEAGTDGGAGESGADG